MDFLKKQAKVEDEIFTFQISDKTTKSVTDFYREKSFFTQLLTTIFR